jgi:hypothetical protein
MYESQSVEIQVKNNKTDYTIKEIAKQLPKIIKMFFLPIVMRTVCMRIPLYSGANITDLYDNGQLFEFI